MSSTPHVLRRPDGTIYYEVRGQGPLLLVIGQPMTSGPFAPLAEQLASDHTVVTYDPHGVGESTMDEPGPVTPEIEADDLAAILDDLGAESAAVFGTSGGAVAGLAFAVRHPQRLTTLIAHEPPVAELLPDAAAIRDAIDATKDTFRTFGAGAAWGSFVGLVMHQGEVTAAGVAPPAWPMPGAGDSEAHPPRTAKQEADDALFFTGMLKPFTRYVPDVQALRAGTPRIVVAIGEDSHAEIASRASAALAAHLRVEPVYLPGGHGGFMGDAAGFARRIREILG